MRPKGAKSTENQMHLFLVTPWGTPCTSHSHLSGFSGGRVSTAAWPMQSSVWFLCLLLVRLLLPLLQCCPRLVLCANPGHGIWPPAHAHHYCSQKLGTCEARIPTGWPSQALPSETQERCPADGSMRPQG